MIRDEGVKPRNDLGGEVGNLEEEEDGDEKRTPEHFSNSEISIKVSGKRTIDGAVRRVTECQLGKFILAIFLKLIYDFSPFIFVYFVMLKI